MPDFSEVLTKFWASHQQEKKWTIETERVHQQFKASIKYLDKTIVTAHSETFNGLITDETLVLEQQAIQRAIDLLP
jgi:hypothetical protein